MNKLPWFTHDHSARNDDFIQRSIEHFGHFGYAAYFMILELLHEHGREDLLKMSPSRLCKELRTKRPQLLKFLEFARNSGKMEFKWGESDITIRVPKFRERQSKMKSKIRATATQPSVNLPLEREGDGHGDRERQVDGERDFRPTKVGRAEPRATAPAAAPVLSPNDTREGEMLEDDYATP